MLKYKTGKYNPSVADCIILYCVSAKKKRMYVCWDVYESPHFTHSNKVVIFFVFSVLWCLSLFILRSCQRVGDSDSQAERENE